MRKRKLGYFFVYYLKIFTGPPIVPSIQCSTGEWDDFVLLTCHKSNKSDIFFTFSENKTKDPFRHFLKILLLQFSVCCCQENDTPERRKSSRARLPATCSERLLLLCSGHCTIRSSLQWMAVKVVCAVSPDRPLRLEQSYTSNA